METLALPSREYERQPSFLEQSVSPRARPNPKSSSPPTTCPQAGWQCPLPGLPHLSQQDLLAVAGRIR